MLAYGCDVNSKESGPLSLVSSVFACSSERALLFLEMNRVLFAQIVAWSVDFALYRADSVIATRRSSFPCGLSPA